MIVRFGTFKKEINSTKVPNVTDWVSLDIQLKEDCSILNPVFRMAAYAFNTDYNYTYIPAWGRYYFIHNMTMTAGHIWEIEMAVDVMASWKTDILNQTCYVRRSASSFSPFIPDPQWSHDSNLVCERSILSTDFSTIGVYLLTVTSEEGGTIASGNPSTTTYVFTPTDFVNICKYLFSSDFYAAVTSGLTAADASIAKMMFNPFQYVVKAMWLPLPLTSIPHSTDKVTVGFGWWDWSAGEYTAYKLTGYFTETTFDFTVGVYDSWIDRDPSWSTYTLYIPGFGQIPISSNYAGKDLTATIEVDTNTGDAILYIKEADTSALLQTAQGRIGVSIQLSSLYENLIQDSTNISTAISSGLSAIVGGAVSAAGSIVSDVMKGSSLGEIVSNSGDAVNRGMQAALQPTCSIIGAMESRAQWHYTLANAIFTSSKYERLSDDHAAMGGMCCRPLKLSGISGYTEIENPHLICGASGTEITMINSFLRGGFYIE